MKKRNKMRHTCTDTIDMDAGLYKLNEIRLCLS